MKSFIIVPILIVWRQAAAIAEIYCIPFSPNSISFNWFTKIKIAVAIRPKAQAVDLSFLESDLGLVVAQTIRIVNQK